MIFSHYTLIINGNIYVLHIIFYKSLSDRTFHTLHYVLFFKWDMWFLHFVVLIFHTKQFCTVSKLIVHSLLIYHCNTSCFIALSLLPKSFQNLHLETFYVAGNCILGLWHFLSIYYHTIKESKGVGLWEIEAFTAEQHMLN